MATRTKKVQVENTENELLKPRTKTVKEIEKENEQLKAEFEKMKKIIESLMSNNTKVEPEEIEENDIKKIEETFEDVRPDKQIPVMSLENNAMYLTTLPKGQGKAFPFLKFGQVRNINYSDLSDIILNHQIFAEDGRFYIMDKNAIHKQGLDDAYKNILNKEQITGILDFKKEKIEELFNKASKAQQETIVSLIVDKIYKGKEVDLNKVDLISKLCRKDVVEMANSLSYSIEEE